MTWIIISIPIMLLAIAIAVLPVLLMSISEARRNFEFPDDIRLATSAATAVDARANGGAGGHAEKAA